MAITLPTPLRVAAGIVASGIDLVRSLPEEIPALPVTLVGKAMQLSMKVQQEIADLATKGDELLSGVLGGPQENPPWAQFDDEPPPSTAVAAGSRQKEPTRPAMPGGAGSARAGAARAAAATRVAEGGKAPVVTPLAHSTRLDPPDTDAPGSDESTPTVSTAGEDNADEKTKQAKKAKDSKQNQDKPHHDRADVTDASRPKGPGLVHPPANTVPAAAEAAPDEAAPDEAAAEDETNPATEPTEPTAPAAGAPDDADTDTDTDTDTDKGGPHGTPADPDGGSANGEAPASITEEAEEVDDGPAALPDYDRMTLAQVRGYLRTLSAQEVQSLLDHEQSGENRAPFLTLLSNRLVTLEHQES